MFKSCAIFLFVFLIAKFLKLVVFGVYDTLTCYDELDWLIFIILLVASRQGVKTLLKIYPDAAIFCEVKMPSVKNEKLTAIQNNFKFY